MKKKNEIVYPNGSVEEIKPDRLGENGGFSLAQLQSLVGGYIECLKAADGRTVYINEEGKLKGLSANPKAQEMLGDIGLSPLDYLVGNVLFLTDTSESEDGAVQTMHFNYLEALRESGATNMWGAAPYLVRKFGVSDGEAGDILCAWMQQHRDG
tara:strand:- start:567 stop:1028 length:462 start_codon:yes stop_codon:yes gene_type:complete